MATDITSLDSSRQPGTIQPVYSIVEFHVPEGSSYGSTYTRLPRAIVERITSKTGPEPSECIIRLPVRSPTSAGGIIQFGAFDHETAIGISRRRNLTSVSHKGLRDIGLWTKIRITSGTELGERNLVKSQVTANNSPRLFVGYVTEIKAEWQRQGITSLILICKDARELLKKTPVQGVLFYNPRQDTTTYIRDHPLVFNEGKRPTRYADPSDTVQSFNQDLFPRFVNPDLNRFLNLDTKEKRDSVGLTEGEDHLYIDDAALDDPAKVKLMDVPFAIKWLPGHVWNYCRNVCSKTLMTGAGRLYDDPSTTLTQNDLPPLHVDDEILIPHMSDNGQDKTMARDFFVPRSFIGAINQTGLATAVSAIGEFAVTGQPLIEVLFELCRRVGNYTLAATYTKDDKLRLEPIRTVPGYTEERNNQTLVAPVGLRGRLRGGSRLLMPTLATKTKRPNIHSMVIRNTTETQYNIFHMKGGPRFIQLTFMTVGSEAFVDTRSPTKQLHGAYQPADWEPKLALPSLRPAWETDDETSWIQLYKTFPLTGDTGLFPDVFRTWIVPDAVQADWVSFIGLPSEIGFRQFFEKDRQLLNSLITSSFDFTTGIYRSRRKKLPVKVWRAFRGIRTNEAGDTAYGPQNPNENTDGQPVPLTGFGDWFEIPAVVEFLTDGRLGFQTSIDGRFNKNHTFENQNLVVPVGAGSIKGPATWNGVFDSDALTFPDARSYEMAMTVAIRVDEDLWESIVLPNTGARNIKQFGPAMELMRDAGSEYQYEEAIHSIIGDSRISVGMLAVPPTSIGDPSTDVARRIYRDDRAEITGRANLMANKFSGGDIESEIQLAGIQTDFVAGQFISRITEPTRGNTSGIEINSIVDVVTHDFGIQQTSLHLATVR